MQTTLTAIFQKVPEGYIGYVKELPGANTQGDTLAEARANLKEAVELVLEANRQSHIENEWLQAVSKNQAFDFLNEPEEDIYTLTDGTPLEH